MTETEYHLKFPATNRRFDEPELIFLINNVKCRLTSALYFILHCYDKYDVEVIKYTSPRWIIVDTYEKRSHNFKLPFVDGIVKTQIELVALGINSENPLYFTECMLTETEGETDKDYCKPHQQISLDVGFQNNRYVNLYNKDGNYLQVIRPQGDGIVTNNLKASPITVIAPHLHDEEDIDDPINIFMEFINQTEQRIDVLR